MFNTAFFFRNDDVRSTLDDSLVAITNLFIKHGVPIVHAVEPANVSKNVVEWLIDIKIKHPHLIEIMQHGYDHSIKNTHRIGEFGGQREYQEQYNEIVLGKELMNKYFGDMWFPAFNFPFGPYNVAAMQAVANAGFIMVNGSSGIDWKRKLFYKTAHLLRQEMFLGYRVPYNLKVRPKTKLFQVDMSVGFIDKYFDEETSCRLYTLDEIQKDTLRFKNQKTVGVLMHHRYHNTQEKVKLIEDYIIWAKTLPGIEFVTLETIYNRFKK